ncbi:MAG: glycoside hydrolase family 3 protein [Treponema sp.]|jgi:beta-N-acetylhexosaminidase|nr:glycoside hydrolase family 3 protein [Treponema sp.]
MRFLFLFTLSFIFFPSCLKNNNKNLDTQINIEEQIIRIDDDPPDLFFLQACEIASSLDDRILAAQVLICGIDGNGRLPAHMKEILREVPAGAIILFRYNLDSGNDEIRVLIAETASHIQQEAEIAPFISVDHEGGTVNRFRQGVARLPAASYYSEYAKSNGTKSALEKAEDDSFNAGKELYNLGINMNFAPVAEYLNTHNGDFLKSRSYGPDPEFTAEAARAFVRGMERAGVLCASKHFPGSAGEDPHLYPAVLTGDRAGLNTLVSPFASLIAGGARAIMISHCAVPSMDSEISSLSSVIMRDWLRNALGFQGIIICDDFSMEAARKSPGNINEKSKILSTEEAIIRSLAAGTDMVLVWQPDIRRTHRAILAAITDGRLSRDRLQEAARRIIYEKLKTGIYIK